MAFAKNTLMMFGHCVVVCKWDTQKSFQAQKEFFRRSFAGFFRKKKEMLLFTRHVSTISFMTTYFLRVIKNEKPSLSTLLQYSIKPRITSI